MSSTSTLSELCRRLDGKPYDPDDDLMTRCLRRALGYVDRTVYPPRFRYLDDRGGYEIVGWVAFDGKSVRSDGVGVTVEGRTFVWRGRKYPPGVYYLIRFSDGREALVSEGSLKSPVQVVDTPPERRQATSDLDALKTVLDSPTARITVEEFEALFGRDVLDRLVSKGYLYVYGIYVGITAKGVDRLESGT